jgi:hypothetical protein
VADLRGCRFTQKVNVLTAISNSILSVKSVKSVTPTNLNFTIDFQWVKNWIFSGIFRHFPTKLLTVGVFENIENSMVGVHISLAFS